MGLKLTIKPNDRVIVNGAILRNAGSQRMVIEIENRSDVLRGDEIMSEADATTPVRRLCYLSQVALASPEHREAAVSDALRILAELAQIMRDSQGPALSEVLAHLDARDFYAAFKALAPVLEHEQRLLALVTPEPGGAPA
ncbi:flagellar biosynthesis repressor FlbT [Sulfitobacter aestuarii]|uniref:Flagellar biosynthesis repressor FlbT n=1 Tax=Sulfitobacter aestuarii TaxID=2161676 RepID=A0ABW5U3C4_9RHOB